MKIKSILQKILQIDDLVIQKHSHSNKSTLDTILQTNIDIWNDKYTKVETDNKISALVTSLDWKESVATYNDISTTYLSPQDGWTVNVKDTDITYRYDGISWIAISANSIPLATNSVDGKMSKQDKIKIDTVVTNATNVSQSTINGNIKINNTETTVYTHPSGTNPHGTTKADVGLGNVTNDAQVKRAEMAVANGVATLDNSGINAQPPKVHTHDDRYYTETEIDNIVGSETLVTISQTLKGAINEVKATVSSGGTVANSTQANKWTNARIINLNGDLSGSVSIDGSTDVTLTAQVIDDSHNHTTSTITNFASNVISTVLTGLSTSTSSVISITDSILSAIGKLQAQITTNLNALTNHISNMNNPHSVTASQLGLGNVTNESKATMFTNPTFTGTATATTFSGVLNGNASTANKLSNARNINIVGDGSGTTTYDGSGDSSIILTLANSGVTAGTYKSVTVDTKGIVTAGTNPATLSGYGITDAVNSSDIVTIATPNKILKLDANSKLPTSITGNADGNAGTATKLANARTISLTGDILGSASFDGSSNINISTTLKSGLTWNDLKGV